MDSPLRQRILLTLNTEMGTDHTMLLPAFQEFRQQLDRQDAAHEVVIDVANEESSPGPIVVVQEEQPLVELAEQPLVELAEQPLVELAEQPLEHEVQVFIYAGDEDDAELRARALDDMENYTHALADWAAEEQEEDDYDYRYDDGYGLDWNESGYYD